MTATALHAEIGPVRQGWRALLSIALLTALWIALNYALPIIAASGISTVAARVSVHVMIALGLWLGLERADLTPAQRRNAWLAVMIPFTLWLAFVWGAAINGVFRGGIVPVPLTPLAIFLPVIIGVPILLRSRRIGQVLDAMPASWLVALQVYRVLGSAFLIGWALGAVPGIFALPAGIGDVITGLLALPGGDRRGRRHDRGPQGRDRLEYLWPARFYRSDQPRSRDFAGAAAADRPEHPQHDGRHLSDRHDPGLRGAELDPAACLVIAAAVSPCASRSNGGAGRGAGARLMR